ncbi:hypothetical protein KI387_043886 [Taxus chinensis]|uniref:Uncharacterized protein n=1 Tax=Taxus chinensis TaxID=29808 RepID=A0AA38CVG1_TAXCH|nr:hypothetical protein KI387_043886 [Taxus chinensis]
MSQGSPKQTGTRGTKVRRTGRNESRQPKTVWDARDKSICEPTEPGEMSQGSTETFWDARDKSTRTGRTG